MTTDPQPDPRLQALDLLVGEWELHHRPQLARGATPPITRSTSDDFSPADWSNQIGTRKVGRTAGIRTIDLHARGH